MEAFSLLKYWKGNSAGGRVRVADGGGASGTEGFPVSSGGKGRTTTILADHAGEFDSDSDEGPFFDLEFAVPADEDVIQKLERENSEIVYDDEEEEEEEDIEDYDDEEEVEGERELKLRPPSSSTSSCENSEPNVSLSPSDEVLFNGRIVHIDGSQDEEVVNSKSGQFPMSASLLRSATKFRVLMLKLKRSKSESTNTATKSQPLKQNQQNNRKLFTVKFKVEEVPVISLLSRASSNSKTNSTTVTATTAEEQTVTLASDSGDEKRNNKKEVMQKYLKLVKPLYIRVSKRNQPQSPASEKTAEEVSAVEEVKVQRAVVGLNLKGMKMAKKHLGKSKSAVVHSHTHSQSTAQNVGSKKRDDSLLQQHDWIQGAILHCKRSFNSSISDLDVEAEEEDEEGSMLTRSASDPSHEKKRTTTATEMTRMEEKENDVVVE